MTKSTKDYPTETTVVDWLTDELKAYHAMIDPELMPNHKALAVMTNNEFNIGGDWKTINGWVNTFLISYIEMLLKERANV